LGEFFDHVIAPLLIRGEVLFQQIREKEKLQDDEHDEQLDKNDKP
jgi:hypothetical protein